MTANLARLKPLKSFSVTVLERHMFQRSPHTIPELRTKIRTDTEAVSTETLTKVLNSFLLRLLKFHDLPGHHIEHIPV